MWNFQLRATNSQPAVGGNPVNSDLDHHDDAEKRSLSSLFSYLWHLYLLYAAAAKDHCYPLTMLKTHVTTGVLQT